MQLLCRGHRKGMETCKSCSFPLSFLLKTGEREEWRAGCLLTAKSRLVEDRLWKG